MIRSYWVLLLSRKTQVNYNKIVLVTRPVGEFGQSDATDPFIFLFWSFARKPSSDHFVVFHIFTVEEKNTNIFERSKKYFITVWEYRNHRYYESLIGKKDV